MPISQSKSTPLVAAGKRLPFAATSPGSVEFTTFFRDGVLRYLLPLTVAFVAAYAILMVVADRPVSLYAYALFTTCGLSLAMAKAGRPNAGLRLYILGSLAILLGYNFPTLTQPNGFATGGAYLFCLPAGMWWMCFAERRTRLVLLGLTVAAMAAVYGAGQPIGADATLPDSLLTLALVRGFFLLGVMTSMCHGFEIAVAKFDERWRNSYTEQNELALRLANQTRDLEREAEAHRSTLLHLSRSEGRYRNLFDNAFDGIVIYDGNKRQPLEINSALCERLGYTFSELKDLSPLEVSPSLQRDGTTSAAARERLRTRLDAGEDVRYDWTHTTRLGELVDFEVYTFCLPAEPNIRISVFRDVTQSLRDRADLNAANRELRGFAHAASHDLKEPLRTMSNFAKLLGRRYADVVDDAGREYIGYITDAAHRGTALVKDLLEYAELGTGSVSTEPVDLTHVAATVRQTVAARLSEEGAQLHIDELPTVLATPTWAHQLLQNLVSNALKFARPGVPSVVHVSATSSALGHEIHVTDNGIGIAPQDLDRVFGAFERLVRREDYEGNGVGLALCRRIVSKLGGDIRVQSTLGEGTTFTIWFPPVDASAPISNATPSLSLVAQATR